VKKVTILDIQAMKERGEKITMLTAYDYPFWQDRGRLRGGHYFGGRFGRHRGPEACSKHPPGHLEDMIYHTRMVARGRQRRFLVFEHAL